MSTFDPKSYELAEHFLADDASEEQKYELALRVQEAAEDYLAELETGRRPGVALVPPQVQKQLDSLKAFRRALRGGF